MGKFFESVLVAIVVVTIGISEAALAQDTGLVNPAPIRERLDVNGVDLPSGTITLHRTYMSYGDPKNPMVVALDDRFPEAYPANSANINPYPSWGSSTGCSTNCVGPNLLGHLSPSIWYALADSSNGHIFAVSTPSGNSNSEDFNASLWSTDPVGTVIWGKGEQASSYEKTSTGMLFRNGEGDATNFISSGSLNGLPTSTTFADGESWTYYFQTQSLPAGGYFRRPKFIVSSRGYGLQFTYNWAGSPNMTWDQQPRWFDISSITFYNKAYVYCDETSLVDCAAVSALPTKVTFTSNYANDTLTVAGPNASPLLMTFGEGSTRDTNGGATYLTLSSTNDTSVPNSLRQYGYFFRDADQEGNGEEGVIASVNDGVKNWSYSVDNGNTLATDPLGKQYGSSGDSFTGEMTEYIDQLYNVWTFEYASDGSDGLIGATEPEGNHFIYARDARNNLTQITEVPKSGSGLSNLVMSASYPSSCINYLTCNKPIWKKDARGNQTDFTYDSNSGGLLTETEPADANGVRPQDRFSYVQRYAWVLNAGGGYVHAGNPVWVLATESHCRASAATGNPSAPCAGNDEVKTTFDYGPDAGPNNLFLKGQAVTADGVTLRTCFAYDQQGRKISETSPNAGLASCP